MSHLEELREYSATVLSIKHQDYQRDILNQLSLSTRCCILQGDRGIGKTTVLVQYLLKQAEGNRRDPRILYISADHFLMAGKTLYDVARDFSQHGGKYLAIDEVHKYPDWSMELKSINDTFDDLNVLATGSSALKIFRGSHDLARRALRFKMLGLSFREYIELKLGIKLQAYDLKTIIQQHQTCADTVIHTLKQHDQKILALFSDYIREGYYPYSLQIKNPSAFQLTLEQSVHAIIESDLAAVHPSLTGHSIKKILQLLAYISSAVPFTPSWSKLKNILGASDERTVKNYVSYLEDAALIRTVAKATEKMSKLEHAEKVYLYNTNLMYGIAPTHVNVGSLRETFFLSMLSAQHEVTLPGKADFQVNKQYLFEIGGRKKDATQIAGLDDAYLALDDLEVGAEKKIPLWLFGFLY